MMKAKKCTCKDWKENIDELNAGFDFMAALFAFRKGYEGKPIEFCPWCGRKLQKIQEEDK
jgi:hypothetical protein